LEEKDSCAQTVAHVYEIGFLACDFENLEQGQRGDMSWILEWLNEQAEGSVVYVIVWEKVLREHGFGINKMWIKSIREGGYILTWSRHTILGI